MSMRIARKKKGIVYFVGRAAKFVTTTIAKATNAPMMSPKEPPLIMMMYMVSGKIPEDIDMTEIPTQPI